MLNIFISLSHGQTLEDTECSHIDVSKIISTAHFFKEFVFNPKPVSTAESPISSLLV